jgi:hypothetical protein
MNQVPAHILARQKRDLVGAAIGGITAGSPAHISIAGNRFTLVDDAGNEKPIQTLYLDACVIDANPSVSKIFFDPRTPFEPGGDNSNPPICWSDNGIGASAQASQPQSTSCQVCPQNAWGSATSKATGKPVKACNDVKKLAVLVPGINIAFLLRIPPASLKNWGKYCNTLAGHGIDLPDALTRFEFESQGVLKFDAKGYIDADTAALTDKVIMGKGTDQLVGKTDRPWGGQGEVQKVEYAQQRAVERIAPAAPVAQQWGDKITVTPAPMAPPPQPFGGGQQSAQAPFGGAQTVFSQSTPVASPFGAPAAATAVSSPSDPFGQPSTSSPTDVTPPKRTRAKKAEATPAADDGIPPFLRREAPATGAFPDANDAARATPPGPSFGMDPNPPAPDAGVQAALDAAFRLPT